MRRITKVALVAAMAVGLGACQGGFSGMAYVREADGAIGDPIAGAQLRFIKEDNSASGSVVTSANGSYTINLSAGRWLVIATHADYADYSSAPGFAVTGSNAKETLNVFLAEPRATTVLVVRHAEKADPTSNAPDEPLSPAGEARAVALADTIFTAGITAVYSTDFVRTRSTVQPLADRFGLGVQLYNSPAALAATINGDHSGDVVLVAGHSNTVAQVAAALGAAVAVQTIGDYDNLYAVTSTPAQSNAVNLQYGDDSTPDLAINAATMTTLLLVQDAGSAAATAAPRLAHASRKAGLTAIYSAAGHATVQPLATELGLSVSPFDDTDVAASVAQILAAHTDEVVAIVAYGETLRAIVSELGGRPFPIISPAAGNSLVVATILESGGAQIVSLTY